MSLQTLTTSASPLTLNEVKAHLRVDGSDDDGVLLATIDSATDWVQEETGQQVVPATLLLTIDAFPASRQVKLPVLRFSQ